MHISFPEEVIFCKVLQLVNHLDPLWIEVMASTELDFDVKAKSIGFCFIHTYF